MSRQCGRVRPKSLGRTSNGIKLMGGVRSAMRQKHAQRVNLSEFQQPASYPFALSMSKGRSWFDKL